MIFFTISFILTLYCTDHGVAAISKLLELKPTCINLSALGRLACFGLTRGSSNPGDDPLTHPPFSCGIVFIFATFFFLCARRVFCILLPERMQVLASHSEDSLRHVRPSGGGGWAEEEEEERVSSVNVWQRLCCSTV